MRNYFTDPVAKKVYECSRKILALAPSEDIEAATECLGTSRDLFEKAFILQQQYNIMIGLKNLKLYFSTEEQKRRAKYLGARNPNSN